jgi:hypothetical protein
VIARLEEDEPVSPSLPVRKNRVLTRDASEPFTAQNFFSASPSKEGRQKLHDRYQHSNTSTPPRSPPSEFGKRSRDEENTILLYSELGKNVTVLG